MGNFINTFASALGERIDILIMPRKGASTKLKLRRLTLWALIVVWLLLTGAGILFFVRGYDYNMIKAENNLMRMKLKLIADELERGRKYLDLTHTTDTQMRQMLGMPGGKFVNLPKGWEEAKAQQDARAKKLFETDLKDMQTEDFEHYVDDLEDSAKTQLASFQEIAWYFANKKEGLNSTPSIRPSSAPISSGYGYRLDPVGRRTSKKHNGVDFAGKPDSPIVVTADGVVRHAGWVPSFGQAILVDHGFGYSTLYAHTTGITVKSGDVVKRGDKIATMGSSGNSTGTHLHYEVWKDGQAVNPRNYFK
ncbi:MAG: peptidoglycan DD-metalloendopeptidase family protein [Elusimicrobiaceae bacterium]|nr:peptidoglycan DD-metalloendopeptidase family protein [Elusimicrobiaceae bacterium]MBP5617151.1 peptidoglycan DD-metalloendopeptidase family protein [Elusimicrobiaceae bacterium]